MTTESLHPDRTKLLELVELTRKAWARLNANLSKSTSQRNSEKIKAIPRLVTKLSEALALDAKRIEEIVGAHQAKYTDPISLIEAYRRDVEELDDFLFPLQSSDEIKSGYKFHCE